MCQEVAVVPLKQVAALTNFTSDAVNARQAPIMVMKSLKLPEEASEE